jgi:Putative beta-barrel porin 2
MAAVCAAAAPHAGAQGLLNLGYNADTDFEQAMPFTWTIGANVGYDSNANLSPINEEESGYMSFHIGIQDAGGDRRTAWQYHASYSPLWYFDAPVVRDEFEHNARVGFDYRHRFNPRLTITNSFYAAYEVEPDYRIGATVARLTQPYFYGHNSLALAYAWNRRFSTVTSWTIYGVWYDDDFIERGDYLTNIFANEFRYALSRTTTLALTYRWAITDPDIGDDYDSHYILAGVDHRFNPRLSGSIRVGAEVRESDSTFYSEGALVYRVSRRTDFRWYGQYGFPVNGTFATDDPSLRTGLTAAHRFNTRFTGNLGIHYIQEDTFGNFDQDIFAFSAGFDYALCKNVSLNGGYSFTTASSDAELLEYDRHQVQLGVASRF